MAKLLPREQWEALRRLYSAGKRGIQHDGIRYGEAGRWDVLRALRDHEPPLAREVYRVDPHLGGLYLVVITEAGERFYDANEELHNLFYPPDDK
ncbi:MAG: hypothetical protein GXY36_14485 [Chloroflexi bacterium]|jgi:hypothetical protein|nr:hypothetical protein [Chloroflexota bacterium]